MFRPGIAFASAWMALWLAVPVLAGESAALPVSEQGFQQEIQASIKPGQTVENALKFLEQHHFECREFQNKFPVIHCSRMDAPRYYQVLIEPARDDRVRTVSSSIGRVRE